MKKKLAIHHRPGSFSDQWIDYCEQQDISYKIVNCYENDIIDQVKGYRGLMWHISHILPQDILIGKQVMFALEQAGMQTFPNFKTMWHFDDKVGQKYLLEAIDAPFIDTYVFFNKKDALEWANKTEFPKVFKLRGGSGSGNVKLVRSNKDARKLIRKAFGKGFKQRDAYSDIRERIRKYRKGLGDLKLLTGGFYRLFKNHDYEDVKGIEKGYVYFQDFIPGNNYDIRVIVIDDKAFAIKRMVRENDFRASGSGMLHYGKENFDNKIINVAFETSKKLQTQSFAVDFVIHNGKPLVVEMSYGFPNKNFIEGCIGYWDEDLNFYEGDFNPYGWMVNQVIG